MNISFDFSTMISNIVAALISFKIYNVDRKQNE